MLLRENGGTLELFRGAPDAWWDNGGVTLRDLPTGFGAVSLRARRGRFAGHGRPLSDGSRARTDHVPLSGRQRARADGKPCDIHGDVIMAPNLSRLVVDF